MGQLVDTLLLAMLGIMKKLVQVVVVVALQTGIAMPRMIHPATEQFVKVVVLVLVNVVTAPAAVRGLALPVGLKIVII